MNAPPTCYGQTRTATCQQEWYETASRDARKRTTQLRKAGYRVFTQAMGPQVTHAGIVRMTLVTIHNPDDQVPEVKVVRI